MAVGDELESFGWWCIFGCNVALRAERDERRVQSAMAIFTNKADEIAERLDHWAMRERVFTMEHTRRERSGEAADFEIKGVSNQEVAEWIRDNLEFDQLILEGAKPDDPNAGWIHVSYSKSRARQMAMTATFIGGRAKYSSGLA